VFSWLVPPLDLTRRVSGIEGLREHAYVENQNFIIEIRYSEGRADRWPELVSELVRLKVDLILVGTTLAALAVKNASSSIPVVIAGAIDPVGAGLAASLARPGGNVTGPATFFPELGALCFCSKRPVPAFLEWPSFGTL